MRNGQEVRDAGRYVRRMAREDGRLLRAAMLHVHDFDFHTDICACGMHRDRWAGRQRRLRPFYRGTVKVHRR